MNWVIRSTKNLEFHTNLTKLLSPIYDELKSCNWILSDLDFITHEDIPIIFSEDIYVLDSKTFEKFLKADVQIIWGVISAIPKDYEIKISKDDFPFAEGNDNIWKNGNLQVANSIVEIIAFDSSYSIVKFNNAEISTKFKNQFPEAIELEKFK